MTHYSLGRQIQIDAMLPFLCCSVLQCIAVYDSVLQCVAVCCSAWQCVAVGDSQLITHHIGSFSHGQRRSDFKYIQLQIFKLVFTGVPITFKQVFIGVPKISNRVSWK